MKKIQYPKIQQVDQVDEYHGTLVADPYRWLEESNSADTKEWIKQQNHLTRSYLEDIPEREMIRKRLEQLWDFPRAYAPLKVSGKYFQLRNSGLQNQNVLHVMDSLEGEKKVLLDPNILSEDGTVALTYWKLSRDGNLLAYATSSSGSDWQIWRVRDVNTRKDLPDLVQWSKFSNVTWNNDNAGFYYAAYDQPEHAETYEALNQYQKVMYHKVGTNQSQDILVYQRPDHPDWVFDPLISDDGRYLILEISKGTDRRKRIFFRELDSNKSFTELIPTLEAAYSYIGNDDELFYFRTNYQAPNGKLIAIDIRNPEKPNWKTIITEGQDAIETIKLVCDQFVVIYLHDAHHQIKRFDLQGNYLGEIELPLIGSIFSFDLEEYLSGERNDDELYFVFNSFIYPPTVFQYSFHNQELAKIEQPDLSFDFHKYKIEQEFATSKDQTRVPMFLVYSKEQKKNESDPALLYGYGGFNISITPNFLVNRLVWLELGGTLAVANLRGGGEYGEEWHQAGSLLKKQNTFDDMIACAEHLIDHDYTSSEKLAIEGRSNGGLLVGACITQRPDLFGAALPAVGVMDMLRFNKFTIGWAWESDYGSPENPEQFKVLYSYSPLHNIIPGTQYPPTLVTTADHDDRVVPAHSFKFISSLQAAQSGDSPVLIRIQTKAGHGFGKPTQVLIEENADILAFLIKTFSIPADKTLVMEQND
jgi:prolyl oligopeptidase